MAQRMAKWLKPLSILIFIAFVAIAFALNFDIFLQVIHLVAAMVLAHNALALTTGYLVARTFSLPLEDQKTLAIETGIQNSGLGLLLIFTFFDGLGGMAIVAAWWGIWHIISGLLVAWLWSGQKDISTTA
jgi:BASS family bile acid:Na+ symporter